MNSKEHWNLVYEQKGAVDVSWFQPEPTVSLDLISSLVPNKEAPLIDVGAGASTLVDKLLESGFMNLTVLDISPVALAHSKQRLGDRSKLVNWIEADVTRFKSETAFELWHDRAVFHFLTQASDRAAYVSSLASALPQGHAIIATFGIKGPEQCSGLDVVRYDAPKISTEFSSCFRLVNTVDELHTTPWGTPQQFTYFIFERVHPSVR